MSQDVAKPAGCRDRILEAADRLFYEQGIRAVGVDTVAAEAGVSKRTLYNYFPSKDALIAAYLELRIRPNRTTDDPPVDQILGYFDRIERRISANGFRGCPFVNAVAEFGGTGHPASAIALAFKERQRLWLRSLIERLTVPDPDRLATQISLLVDGAIAAALVRADPAMARAGREAAQVLLENAQAKAAECRSSSISKKEGNGDVL
jgi:AcrR family transcriptional regulator